MGADIKGGRSFRTLYTTIKTKNCLYGGFFVLKDREAFDSKQRGSWATRRRGRRKYADEGKKARTTTIRRCEHCEQDNPVIPTNHTAVTLNLIGTFFMSLFSYITKKPIIALQIMDFFYCTYFTILFPSKKLCSLMICSHIIALRMKCSHRSSDNRPFSPLSLPSASM